MQINKPQNNLNYRIINIIIDILIRSYDYSNQEILEYLWNGMKHYFSTLKTREIVFHTHCSLAESSN